MAHETHNDSKHDNKDNRYHSQVSEILDNSHFDQVVQEMSVGRLNELVNVIDEETPKKRHSRHVESKFKHRWKVSFTFIQ